MTQWLSKLRVSNNLRKLLCKRANQIRILSFERPERFLKPRRECEPIRFPLAHTLQIFHESDGIFHRRKAAASSFIKQTRFSLKEAHFLRKEFVNNANRKLPLGEGLSGKLQH